MSDYEPLDTRDFKTQPISIVNRFHEDDKEQLFDLSVVDCAYALLTDEQYDEWLTIFNSLDNIMYEDNVTSCLRFKWEDKNFVMIADSGDEISHGEFQEYCENKGIASQFDIDCPIIYKQEGVIDWDDEECRDEFIYTGCGSDQDNPELIKIMYILQHGE